MCSSSGSERPRRGSRRGPPAPTRGPSGSGATWPVRGERRAPAGTLLPRFPRETTRAATGARITGPPRPSPFAFSVLDWAVLPGFPRSPRPSDNRRDFDEPDNLFARSAGLARLVNRSALAGPRALDRKGPLDLERYGHALPRPGRQPGLAYLAGPTGALRGGRTRTRRGRGARAGPRRALSLPARRAGDAHRVQRPLRSLRGPPSLQGSGRSGIERPPRQEVQETEEGARSRQSIRRQDATGTAYPPGGYRQKNRGPRSRHRYNVGR